MSNNKPLNQVFADEPYRFEFFQAVRLLEKIFPERKPVGGAALPDEEVVRFRSRMSLNFPASELYDLTDSVDDRTGITKHELVINFMGMTGPIGVLPVHYTELLIDRARYRDTAMWAFLDIYTHRSASLFYRAWEKYRFPVQYERGNDHFTEYLFDIVGLGTKGLRGRMALEDESLLPYAGLIANKPHSANSLEQILSDYFSIKAKTQQFFGQWIDLEEADFSRIGTQNNTLGLNTIIGTQIWDQQSKFRLRLGALSFDQFQSFLPNGTAHKPLKSIVRFMIGLELDFDTQLILEAKQVPACILTTRAKRRPMLGWTSWLKTQPFEEDDEQVVLQMD
ncbi:MAG TPA: type VI secretion system baseplate subunit TssG [Pyrinomonadaceae bacterium]|nr:type VI secretion system baseplate subunit TssG [Pyrinomonadaceae bacterium]